MPDYDVFVVGDYCLDLVFTGLGGMPEAGREVFASGFTLTAGGAFNSAAALQRLGVRTAWACDFGSDPVSRLALEIIRREGLDESQFVFHQGALQHVTVSASFPAERAFLTYNDPGPALPAGFRRLAGASARLLLVPGLYSGRLFEAGLKILRAKKMKIAMDCNVQGLSLQAQPAARRALQRIDLFLPNAREVLDLTGEPNLEAGMRQLAALCPLVVVKDGANGAFACQGERLLHVPALPVKVLDTTGAGDCFNAGFIKAWLEERPLEECLRWGVALGSLSTEAPGGTGRRITAADVEQALRKMGGG